MTQVVVPGIKLDVARFAEKVFFLVFFLLNLALVRLTLCVSHKLCAIHNFFANFAKFRSGAGAGFLAVGSFSFDFSCLLVAESKETASVVPGILISLTQSKACNINGRNQWLWLSGVILCERRGECSFVGCFRC